MNITKKFFIIFCFTIFSLNSSYAMEQQQETFMGIPINIEIINVPSIIYLAAIGNTKKIQKIIETCENNGFPLNLNVNFANHTPLWYANNNHHKKTAQYLESQGATEAPQNESADQRQNFPPTEIPTFIWYLIIGNIAQAKQLIQKYQKQIPTFNLNLMFLVNDTPDNALNSTAICGQTQCLDELIKLGANVNNIPATYSALHFACIMGQVDCIKFLLSTGADVQLEDKDNRYIPFMCLIKNQDIETIKKAFEEINIDPNSKNSNGLSLLDSAIINTEDSTNKINFLLGKGAQINYTDIAGFSALHYAAIYCNPDVVILLLKNGANVFAIEKIQGNTPAKLALINKKYINYKILKEAELYADPTRAICQICKKQLQKGDLYSIFLDDTIIIDEDCVEECIQKDITINGKDTREIKIFNPQTESQQEQKIVEEKGKEKETIENIEQQPTKKRKLNDQD